MLAMRKKNALAAVLIGALSALVVPSIANAATTVLPNGTYYIRNVNSKLFMQPTGNSTANGAVIVQQGAPSGSVTTAQLWGTSNNGTANQFKNVHSGRNLGIDGASTTAGANAIQATPSAATNQYWYPTKVSGSIYTLKNAKSTLCLGVDGASTGAGASVKQFACDGKANQQWTIAAV